MRGRAIAAVVVMLTSAALLSQPGGVHRANWLQGCWESSMPARTIEEIWTAPKGDSMMGISRTIRDGKLVEYEMVVLREQGERLAYVAHPSGQPPATFLSTRVSPSELMFENPAHDFPQQIGYRRDGEALVAWISGVRDGRTRRVEFPYRRVRCVE
jgi:hypothetical protein